MISPQDLGPGWAEQATVCDDRCDIESFHGCETRAFRSRSYYNGQPGEAQPSGFELQVGVLEGDPEKCVLTAIVDQYGNASIDTLELDACFDRVVTFDEDRGKDTMLVVLFVSGQRSAASLDLLYENAAKIDRANLQFIAEITCTGLNSAESS